MQKRVIVIQDLCCLGQCSLTESLPILSSLGVEVCPLPTALLSSHSVGFKTYSRLDLLEEAGKILGHLKQESVQFDAVLAGYMSDVRQQGIVDAALSMLKPCGKLYLDPAMADGGELYPDLSPSTVDAMRTLAARAEVMTPNYDEACLLAGEPICSVCDMDGLARLSARLYALGAKNVVITGADLADGKYGVFAYDGKTSKFFVQPKVNRVCHGAGDAFFSALCGLMLGGADLMTAVKAAADFTYESILNTLDDRAHWYGINFEGCLKDLIAAKDNLL